MEDITQVVRDGLSKIEAKIYEHGDRLRDLEQRSAIMRPGDLGGSRGSIIREITSAPSFKSLLKRETKAARIPLETSIARLFAPEVKATLVADSQSSDGSGYMPARTQWPGFTGDARRRLSVLDALASIPVSNAAFVFNRIDSYSNAAAYQSEQGDAKAEATTAFDLITANIATIAHFLPVAEQLLADEPALAIQLQTLLQHGLREKLEAEIITGAGGTGEIGGLTLAGSHTAYTPSSSSDVTGAGRIGEAAANLDALGWTASLVILHPTDWFALRNEKATGSGEFLAGSWAVPAPPSVWSIPVVTSPSLTAGKFIVMDSSQVAILDRMAAVVEVGYSGDGFTKNVQTLRAELRAGLAVFSPTAILYGDLEG